MNGRKAVRAAAVLWSVPLVVAILHTSPRRTRTLKIFRLRRSWSEPRRISPKKPTFLAVPYHYQVSWQGIPVGSASIRIGTTYR